MLKTFTKTKAALTGIILSLALGANAQYCVPTFASGCAMDNDINSFTLTGDNSTTINDLNTHCSLNAYNNQPAVLVDLSQGLSYTAFINSDAPDEAAQVFIDFNNDYNFSSSESVGGANYIDNIGTTFNINIPPTAITGSHRMRVVLSYDFGYPFLNGCPDALNGYDYGEVHDYTANIIAGSGGSTCLAPAFIAASGANGNSVNIIWSAVPGALGYEYVLDQNPASPAGAGIFTTATTLNPTTLTPNVQYHMHIRTQCGATSFSPWFDHAFVSYTAGSCIAPDGFTATSISGTSATLSWNAVPGSLGYEVFLTDVPSLIPLNGTPIAGTGANYNSLNPYTTYYGYLRHECSNNTTSNWAMITLTTGGTILPQPAEIYGYIYADDTSGIPSADSYRVWLINYDSSSTTLTAIDSTVASGSYLFNNVSSGNYLIKAAKLDTAVTVLGQVPTYQDSSLYWNTAPTTVITPGVQLGRDIWMRQGIVTAGQGFIAGNVSLGANKGTSGGVANMIIYLRNTVGKLVKAARTDASGNFSFSSLPSGIYNVYPEQMGYATTPYNNIAISSAQINYSEIDFNQDNTQRNIKPRIVTGISGLTNSSIQFRLMPNPAKNEVTLSGVKGGWSVTVTDVAGHIIKSEIASSDNARLDISTLRAGLYFIHVKSATTEATQKLIIQP